MSELSITPPEYARLRRVSADKVLRWIGSGELKAVNIATSRRGRPRWVIPAEAITAFEAAVEFVTLAGGTVTALGAAEETWELHRIRVEKCPWLLGSETKGKYEGSISMESIVALPAGEESVSELSVVQMPLRNVRMSPENNKLYRPVLRKDPEVKALAKSIGDNGVLEPLVITEDGWIVSGHRRYIAASMAGLKTVPCRILAIRRGDDPAQFVKLLREHNRQRTKSLDEILLEEVVSTNKEDAYQALIEARQQKSDMTDFCGLDLVDPGDYRWRKGISSAKQSFLQAVLKVLGDMEAHLPLSDRQIHYQLLNARPLMHAKKPDSAYANTQKCYKNLVDLLTRARLTRQIPMGAIADETRPVTVWNVHRTPSTFLHDSLDEFLTNYWRDRLQSQPNHIECIGEKNTVQSLLKSVAMDYTLPLTIARGYMSLPPRADIARRFKESGKEKLILIICSDFDADGEEIASSLARSLRDDFDIENLQVVKAALTADQIRRFKLVPTMKAKKSSGHHKKFVKKFGDNVFELEALSPVQLQQVFREAIESVLDMDAYGREVEAEKQDAAFLVQTRNKAVVALAGAVGAGGAK